MQQNGYRSERGGNGNADAMSWVIVRNQISSDGKVIDRRILIDVEPTGLPVFGPGFHGVENYIPQESIINDAEWRDAMLYQCGKYFRANPHAVQFDCVVVDLEGRV